jgi:predicted amidohydrolase YtcJ
MSTILKNFRWGFTGELQELEVADGRVAYRGPIRSQTHGEDLSGRTLWPSFIDNHCHILPTGLDLLKLNLGHCASKDEVLSSVRDRHASIAPGEWLMAVHYDQTKFSDGRHIDRHDLDRISAERPIVLRHVSGHAGVANTAALKAAGINRDTPDPAGGEFVREDAGDPNGVLLETALEQLMGCTPALTTEQMTDAILLAAHEMAKFGISCATDMQTGRYDLERELAAYQAAAERGSPVRFRLCIQWSKVLGPRPMSRERLAEWQRALDPDTVKIIGLKIFADGAIGSATAAIYGRYQTSPASDTGDQGQLIYEPSKLSEMVRQGHEAGYQISIHTIGDRSTDLVMDAYEALGADASRHRIEHAMILSDAQIARMARIGCHVTMQPEFLTRFQHAYRKQLGPEKASRLKRFRSVRDAGLRLSLSSDRPIVLGDTSLTLKCATNRPEGYDPSENLAYREAIEGMTSLAAAANEDADRMGSLEVGQLADFRIEE